MRSFLCDLLLTSILLIALPCSSAQNYYDFSFQHEQNITVSVSDRQFFLSPWCGGLNAIRVSEFDLNHDDIMDLLIFDKHGNKLLPFLNLGINDSISYQYAPEYAHNFPQLHNWVIFKDYNQDGLPDIFTYGLAGIMVYQNISYDNQILFQLITEQLQSFYYDGYTNLYTSPDDYIALEDIDGDGDLDILNFWLLGKYVHYHRNYSIENYGDCSHLDFKLEDECWGHFEEGEDNNSILLHSVCNGKDAPMRHTGSTLYALDFNQNGLIDLILGDIDFPNLIYLENGGTLQHAEIIAQDTLFPNPEEPIYLFSMPAINFVDVNNDGIKEIIAAPTDPSLTKSQDVNNIWLYQFNNQDSQYHKISESFLQQQMIDVGSGCYPVFFDWDNDGLTDLFVSNYGQFDSAAYHLGYLSSSYSSSISYFHNIGTPTTPHFRLEDTDFGGLKKYGFIALYPTFTDLNGDNQPDLVCGNADGTLLAILSLSDSTFDTPIQNFANIDVGDYSTPQYFDIDNDGKDELLIGNRRGHIQYYRPSQGTYSLICDTLGGVDVRDADNYFFGYCVPHFFKDNHGTIHLFCGSEQGDIIHYDSIDNNLNNHPFRCKEPEMVEMFQEFPYPISEGIRTAPAVADLNHDGYLDMVVGNYSGGLSLFMGMAPVPIAIHECAEKVPIQVYPNPTNNYFIITNNYSKNQVLTLTDIAGHIIFHCKLLANETKQINIPNVSPGLYCGRIGNSTFKIVIIP